MDNIIHEFGDFFSLFVFSDFSVINRTFSSEFQCAVKIKISAGSAWFVPIETPRVGWRRREESIEKFDKRSRRVTDGGFIQSNRLLLLLSSSKRNGGRGVLFYYFNKSTRTSVLRGDPTFGVQFHMCDHKKSLHPNKYGPNYYGTNTGD